MINLKGKGLYITDAMTDDQLQSCMKYIDTLDKKSMYHTNIFWLWYKENPEIINILNSASYKGVEPYLKMANKSIDDYLMYDMNVVHEWHLNKAMDDHQDAVQHDPKDGYGCDISVLLYLGEEFKGGEITFKELDITIKPEPRSVLVFDSMLTHSVTPVTSGKRVVIDTPMFLNNRVDVVPIDGKCIPAKDKFRVI